MTEAAIAKLVAAAVAEALKGTTPAKGKAKRETPSVPSMFLWRGIVAAAPGKPFTAKLKSGEIGHYTRHTLAEATAILEAQYAAGSFYASRSAK